MSDTEVESDPATEEEEEEELDDDSTSSSESDAEVAVKPARDPRRRPIVPESDDDGVVAKLPTNTISFSLPTVSLALSEALAGGDKARAEDVRPPRLLSAALHPHQLIALKWLAGLWHAVRWGKPPCDGSFGLGMNGSCMCIHRASAAFWETKWALAKRLKPFL